MCIIGSCCGAGHLKTPQLLFMARLATCLADQGLLCCCSSSVLHRQLPLPLVSFLSAPGCFRQCKTAALPGRQHSLQSCGGVRQGSRRLRGSMCWGSLEVKHLQLRRQLARVCSQPPVGTRHLLHLKGTLMLVQECWLLPQGTALQPKCHHCQGGD